MLKKVIINKTSGNILCERARVRQDILTDVLKTIKKTQTMLLEGDVVFTGCVTVDGMVDGTVVGTPIVIGGPIAPESLTNFSGLLGAIGTPDSSIMYNEDDSVHERFIQYNVTTGRRSGDFFQTSPAATGALQVCWAQGPASKQVSRLMFVSGTNYVATYDIQTGATTIVQIGALGGLNTMGFGAFTFDSIGNAWLAYMADAGLATNYIMLQIDPNIGTITPSPAGFQSLGFYVGGMIKVGTSIVASNADSPAFINLNSAGEALTIAPWEGSFTFEGDVMPWLQEMLTTGDLQFGNITYDSSSGKVYILINQPIPTEFGGDFQPACAIGWFYFSELQFATGAPGLGTPGPITLEKSLVPSPGNGENESLALNLDTNELYRWTGYSNGDFAMHTIDIDTLADGPNLFPGGDNLIDEGSASAVAWDPVNGIWFIAYQNLLYTLDANGDPNSHDYIGTMDESMGGLEFAFGSFYGVDKNNSTFYELDPTDGSTIASFTLNVLPSTASQGGQGLSYNAELDELFILYKQPSDGPDNRHVGIINVANGEITNVFDGDHPYATIAFDHNNKLWLAVGIGGGDNALYSVDGLVGGGIEPETFDIRILSKMPSENPHGIVYVD